MSNSCPDSYIFLPLQTILLHPLVNIFPSATKTRDKIPLPLSSTQVRDGISLPYPLHKFARRSQRTFGRRKPRFDHRHTVDVTRLRTAARCQRNSDKDETYFKMQWSDYFFVASPIRLYTAFASIVCSGSVSWLPGAPAVTRIYSLPFTCARLARQSPASSV